MDFCSMTNETFFMIRFYTNSWISDYNQHRRCWCSWWSSLGHCLFVRPMETNPHLRVLPSPFSLNGSFKFFLTQTKVQSSDCEALWGDVFWSMIMPSWCGCSLTWHMLSHSGTSWSLNECPGEWVMSQETGLSVILVKACFDLEAIHTTEPHVFFWGSLPRLTSDLTWCSWAEENYNQSSTSSYHIYLTIVLKTPIKHFTILFFKL